MLAQRQAVDHRDRGLGRELDDDLVRARPGDDRVDEAVEVAGDVTDALPRAQDDVVGQVDRVAAELVHPGLERHPRPEARLLEQHRQRPARERRLGVPAVAPELGLEARGAPRSNTRDGPRHAEQIGERQQITVPRAERRPPPPGCDW